MTTDHINTCKNNCIYAKKVMWLSRAGTSEDWLYRCTKLEDRLITTDSVIHELGCATFTTGVSMGSKDDLVKRGQDLLDEINQKIKEDQKKEVPLPAAVPESVKPVEKKPEPVVVPEPTTIPPQQPTVQIPSVPPVIATEEPAKKKRGRKPKQATVEPAPAAVSPEKPKELIKEEMIKDGGSTDGTKT